MGGVTMNAGAAAINLIRSRSGWTGSRRPSAWKAPAGRSYPFRRPASGRAQAVRGAGRHGPAGIVVLPGDERAADPVRATALRRVLALRGPGCRGGVRDGARVVAGPLGRQPRWARRSHRVFRAGAAPTGGANRAAGRLDGGCPAALRPRNRPV